MSTFSGLEASRKALMAHRKALNTTNHNVANANTPGYSRQRAVFESAEALGLAETGLGNVGNGVEIEKIERVRNQFLDHQIRNEKEIGSQWETRKNYLNQIELIFNEPGDTGIRKAIDDFFVSWQELSKDPDNHAVRTTLRQDAISLTGLFQHTHNRLYQLQSDADTEIAIKISDINSLAEQIADLNQQIVRIETSGEQANDLRDRRDLLVDELSELIDIRTVERANGGIEVSLDNRFLVSGNRFNELDADSVPVKDEFQNSEQDTVSRTMNRIVWKDSEREVRINRGELSALIGIRGSLMNPDGVEDSLYQLGEENVSGIPGYLTELNLLAEKIVDEVNTLHQSGFGLDGETGRNFFDSELDNASQIQIAPDIADNLDHIAASPSVEGLPGDASLAIEIAGLSSKGIYFDSESQGENEGISFVDFYTSTISRLGVEAQESEKISENQKILIEHLTQRRESISGVSLDEEMVNMIRFQHAYNAASRNITVVDEMLQTLINMI